MMQKYNAWKLPGIAFVIFCLLAASITAQAKTKEAAGKRNNGAVEKTSQGTQPANVYKDCADCPDMIAIPSGGFEMGSPSVDAETVSDESPVHHVNVKSFLLGKTHITRGQFAAFVKATNYDAGKKCWVFDQSWQERDGANWRNPGYPQQENHPAACINWYDARAYANWLTRKTGKQYRLPTEAEWEYAARAGSAAAHYWGENSDQACGHANVGDQKLKSLIYGVLWETHNCDDGYAFTSPVGSYKPNAFGLYDMQGNLWQWVLDSWTENYNQAPTDSSDWPDVGVYRVLRGGSWSIGPLYLRSAKRIKSNASDRVNTDGFRVARSLQ